MSRESTSRSLTGKFGEQSRRWKGEEASYVAKHMWIIKHYGKASKCTFNPNHQAKRYEWANISGNYHREITDYIPLCPSCHRKFDGKNSCKHGHEYTEKTTYMTSNGHRACKICRAESSRNWRKKKNAAN